MIVSVLLVVSSQVESAVLTVAAAFTRHPSADTIGAAELNNISLPTQSYSARKLVALPSEATVMVNGQKCVLRVGNNGRLTACPVAIGMCFLLESLCCF